MSMSQPEAFPIPQFQVEREDKQWVPPVICIDDRPSGIVGQQFAGGPDGIARDIATAMEIDKPGSFVDMKVEVHRFTPAVSQWLEAKNIQAFMHHVCAAHENAEAVRTDTVVRTEEVFGQTQLMGFRIGETDADQMAEASWRILDSKLIVPAEKSIKDLTEGMPEHDLPAVEHVHLRPGEHVANDFVVSHEDDKLWNAAAAFDAGHPAYYSSAGMLKQLHSHIEDLIPVSYASFKTAYAMRLGSISLNLPRPNGQPLQIHAVGEAEAA